MVDVVLNDATAFFQSTIGMVLSTVLLFSALIPGAKFLNKKLDERIDANVEKKIKPLIEGVCKQLTEVTTAMKVHQAATSEAIIHINGAIGFLEDLIAAKND